VCNCVRMHSDMPIIKTSHIHFRKLSRNQFLEEPVTSPICQTYAIGLSVLAEN